MRKILLTVVGLILVTTSACGMLDKIYGPTQGAPWPCAPDGSPTGGSRCWNAY